MSTLSAADVRLGNRGTHLDTGVLRTCPVRDSVALRMSPANVVLQLRELPQFPVPWEWDNICRSLPDCVRKSSADRQNFSPKSTRRPAYLSGA